MTIRRGLSTLQIIAAAWPISLPASRSARRLATSPASARAITAAMSGCPARRAIASMPAVVSRQPRLPQRHSSPSAVRVVWPISPAVPIAPPYSRSSRIRPGADAARQLQVDDVRGARAGAPGDLGDGAGVGVVLDVHGHAEPPRHRARQVDAGERGDRGRLADAVPCARSTGPGIASPAPISRSAGRPGRLRAPPPRRAAIASSTASSGRSAGSANVSSASMTCPRSASDHAPGRPADVDADRGAGGRVERDRDAGPADAVGRRRRRPPRRCPRRRGRRRRWRWCSATARCGAPARPATRRRRGGGRAAPARGCVRGAPRASRGRRCRRASPAQDI